MDIRGAHYSRMIAEGMGKELNAGRKISAKHVDAFTAFLSQLRSGIRLRTLEPRSILDESHEHSYTIFGSTFGFRLPLETLGRTPV